MKKPPTIQLSKLQPKFHLLKHDRKPYLTPQTESLLDIVKDLYLKGKRKLVTRLEQISRHKFRDLRNQSLRNDFLKEAAGLLKRFPKRPRWEWLVIALLLGLLFARPAGAVIHDAPGVIAPAPKVVYIKPVQPLKQVLVKKVHTIALKPVAPPVAAPVVTGGCQTYWSGDYYLDNIIRFESGGNSCATNYLGCFGLLQACPGEPLRVACGGNPSCQIAWFQANKTGGRSWAQVWQHELTYGWW